MLQFAGESKYADVIERALYNGFLSSISLTGDRFFYENPLASVGKHQRQHWFNCPCCPPNVARTLASLGGYFYSTGRNSVWVHLYAQGTAHLHVNGNEVRLRQITNYPWEGEVNFEISLEHPQAVALHLRVPSWCDSWQLTINGVPAQDPTIRNGYVSIERTWQNGDTLTYTMQMPIQAIWAHPAVRDLKGKVAMQRGPMVYCIEGTDHPGSSLDKLMVNPEQVLMGQFQIDHRENLLGGISVLRGTASMMNESEWTDKLYRHTPPLSQPAEITAIPYYAWGNREPGEMRVWIPSTAI